MLAKDTLRKTDLISGTLIVLLGIFIVSQALQMPMKDSWGGVQNVWFVSPALFPLFVGTMLILLGAALFGIGLRYLGADGLRAALDGAGGRLSALLHAPAAIRFYAVVSTLVIFVFLLVPRVDFFAAAVLFLLLLFSMFYYGEEDTLPGSFAVSLVCALLFVLLMGTGLSDALTRLFRHPGDWLAVVLILALSAAGFRSTAGVGERRRRFFIGLTVAVITPLVIGIIFKYLLLVPMPHEGLVVQLLDTIRYAGH